MSWNAREYAPSSSASTTALTAMGRRSRPPRSASSRSRLSSRLWRLSSSRMSVFLVRLRVLRRRVSSMRAIRGAPEARPENGERIQSGISEQATTRSPPRRSRARENRKAPRQPGRGAHPAKRQPDLERGRDPLSSKTRSKVTEQASGIGSGDRHGGRRTGARGTSCLARHCRDNQAVRRLARRCRDDQAVRRLARRGPADLSETQGGAGARGVSPHPSGPGLFRHGRQRRTSGRAPRPRLPPRARALCAPFRPKRRHR